MKISIEQMIFDLKFQIIAGTSGLNKSISSTKIDTPLFELLEVFPIDKDFTYVVGKREMSFLSTLEAIERQKRLENFFSSKPVIIIFANDVEIKSDLKGYAEKYEVVICQNSYDKTSTISKLFCYYRDILAIRESVHGTLVQIDGFGTLIIGKSGIGKSETALELVKLGHQLISDDLVEIYETDIGTIIGTAPDKLKQYIEVRGVGVVNIFNMFGIRAFQDKSKIDFVVELEVWNNEKSYDRLGNESSKIKFFNTEISKITIPILPGRNIASLIEAATMNEKLKKLGYNMSLNFINQCEEVKEK